MGKLHLLSPFATLVLFPVLLTAQAGSFTSYGSGCAGSGGGIGCVSANFNNLTTSNFSGNRGGLLKFALLLNTGSQARVICAVELYCSLRSSTSASMDVWIYDSNSSNKPGKILAASKMPVTNVTKVNRATLSKPLVMQANTAFFLVFDNKVDLNLPIMRSGTAGTHYHNATAAWSGPFSTIRWNYNILCCGGNSVPKLSNTGVPTINKSFSIDLSNANANATALLAIGVKKTSLDLTPAGAPGCTLLTDPLVAIGLKTNASGSTSLNLPVPNNRGLIGVQVFTQYAVFDPANALGIVFSNGGDAKVGV